MTAEYKSEIEHSGKHRLSLQEKRPFILSSHDNKQGLIIWISSLFQSKLQKNPGTHSRP